MFVKVASDIVVKLNYDCEMLNYIASFLLIFVCSFGYGQSDEFLGMKALAESGDVEAQFYLAYMYDNGNEVPENDKTAVKWYIKAAEQGYAEAQGTLGLLYATGRGVLSSNVKAYMWLNLAAFNGDEGVSKYKDIISKQMTSEQIGRAQDLSEACLAKNYKGC